eukprot:2323755-Rhodomonas_salina.2
MGSQPVLDLTLRVGPGVLFVSAARHTVHHPLRLRARASLSPLQVLLQGLHPPMLAAVPILVVLIPIMETALPFSDALQPFMAATMTLAGTYN